MRTLTNTIVLGRLRTLNRRNDGLCAGALVCARAKKATLLRVNTFFGYAYIILISTVTWARSHPPPSRQQWAARCCCELALALQDLWRVREEET